jgi:hypothetical protein
MPTWMSSPYRFDQIVAPNTTWFPTVVNYQGNPVIERRITEEIASIGKQLGLVSDALLEVAGKKEHKPQLARLRKIVQDIEPLKTREHRSLMDETTRSFEALVKEDRDKARRLVDTLANVVEGAERKQK